MNLLARRVVLVATSLAMLAVAGLALNWSVREFRQIDSIHRKLTAVTVQAEKLKSEAILLSQAIDRAGAENTQEINLISEKGLDYRRMLSAIDQAFQMMEQAGSWEKLRQEYLKVGDLFEACLRDVNFMLTAWRSESTENELSGVKQAARDKAGEAITLLKQLRMKTLRLEERERAHRIRRIYLAWGVALIALLGAGITLGRAILLH